MRGSGPNVAQATKAITATAITAGTNQPRHLVGQPLDRRARALRRAHHLHDLRDQRVAADLAGAHHERAGLVDGAADHLAAGLLGDRHRFAGDHRLVDGGAAFDQLAVDRHLVAGPHPQLVADRDRIERDFLVAAVRLDAPRGLGRELEQRADRARGRLARAQFQHLAEQHQHGDDGGGLEIDRHRAVMAAERRRKHARRQRRDHAVDVGDAGAHRDQREHVEIARDQRLPAAHEERRARPQHHRRRERELNPVRRGLVDEPCSAEQVRAHLQHEHRHGQREADPEPPRHVGEFGIGAGVGGRRPPARAPCRRSGRCRARPGGSPDASGRCRSCRRARRRAAASPARYFSGSAANLVRQPAEQK